MHVHVAIIFKKLRLASEKPVREACPRIGLVEKGIYALDFRVLCTFFADKSVGYGL